MPRPQYGLPFKQLPQRALTPESMLDEERRTGQQRIQSKYALQWKTAVQSKRFIGQGKVQRMLRDIDARAKQEMLQFNQQMQQQSIQLQNVNRLAQQGAINNPEQIKARMTFGPDIAKSMYPAPEKGRTPATVMGELSRYKEIVQSNLDRYRSVKAKERWKFAFQEKSKIQFLDYSLPAKKKDEVGAWRDTTKEDIGRQDFWKQELKEIEEQEMEIVGIPGIKHRIVQPGTTGGTFSDKIVESYKKPVTRQRPARQQPGQQQPKVIRQRNKNTGQIRESRDGGKTWQIVNG